MAGIKIVDLPAVGRDLAATDLFEMSLAGGTGSRKITGQEIMNASKLSVNNTPVINGTAGRIFFQGSTNVLQQSGNLFWDDVNGRLGIGTATPAQQLHVFTSVADTGILLDSNTNPTFTIRRSGSDRLRLTATGSIGTINGVGNGLVFQRDGSEAMRIASATSNVLINTTTDAGFRLDVNGTARVTSLTTMDLVSTSPNQIIFIKNSSGTTAGRIFPDGSILRFSSSNSLLALSVFANANIGIGQATDDGFRLDVNGTARVATSLNTPNVFSTGGPLSLYGGFTNRGRIDLFNSTTGLAIDFQGNGSSRMQLHSNGNLLIGTTTDSGYKLDVNGDTKTLGLLTAYGISTNLSDMAIYNTTNNTGYIRFITQTASAQAERMRIFNTGNVAIGTTTDSGFKLEVNGTARVTGTGSTSATTSLTVRNSAGTAMLTVKDGGIDKVVVMPSAVIGQIEISGLNIGAGGGNTVSILNPVAIGGTLAVASAALQVDGTTRGFLPPRMTQTQRNAIASPAIGLEIYQTDATEGKYIYKSSGWTYIG
jgi:hypothetical protein